jgi:prolyl 4-hydroxylase
MTPVDVEALRQRASSGDGDAQMALARVFDREGRHDVALQWLQRAADGGHLPSLTALGARLLTGRGAPQMPSQGSQMLSLAADEGDAQACAIVAILTATGLTRPQSWSGALDYLFRAAQLGDWRARQQIAILVNNPALGTRLLEPSDAPPWIEARAAIDMGAWLRPPAPKKISESPRIVVFENFLSRTVCEWLIELAQPKLSASRVLNPGSGERLSDPYRTNTGMGFTLLETDVLLQIVNMRIAAASGTPLMHQEATNILHYAAGQEYKPHYDFFDPEVANFAEVVRREGQRIVTFLIYLNDTFEGGETEFSLLGARYRGQPGDAVMFVNVDAQGGVDKRTLHAGRPVVRGEKWLLSKWIRDRPLPQF